jgi:hypothetical protein
MEKESKPAGGIPSGGIMAIVMLAAGFLFIRAVPLEATRPPVNEPKIQQTSTEQDMDARLWQDPFGAVARAREEAQKRNPERARAADKLRRPDSIGGDKKSRKPRMVEVLAVMLQGGPYSEDIESRRRVRYAVLAGLNASRLVPEDAEHLGYVFPAEVDKPDPTLPEIVPFEWFEPASERDDNTAPRVLVLWIDSTVFKEKPLQKMRELAARFKNLPGSWRVLGPARSDGLRDMADEVRLTGAASLPRAPPHAASPRPHAATMHFYSAVPTSPDTRIDRELPANETLSGFFSKHGVQLVRTIGDDNQLANALIKELTLRGLHAGRRAKGGATCYPGSSDAEAPSHIAIISEWDTLYGRTLRREFQASPDEDGFCVHRASYVRGLDGQLPTPGGAEAAPAKADSGKSGAENKNDSRQRDGTYLEIAEGQSQFDYLRRLAKRLTERDKEVRKSSPDGMGLRAIGVLGSDVHDKLLVLQALQPEFPNAIFFTTDLDARLLHPREKAWTRNLIVASHFNLRLSDTMQADMPIFRDSYQTSVFLATRLAMDDAQRALKAPAGSADSSTRQETIAKWFNEPRLFEIGRTQAFDFSPPPPPAPAVREPGSACKGPDWDHCGSSIHPMPSPLYPQVPMATLLFVASLLILMLWLPPVLVSRGVRRRLVKIVLGDSLGQRIWRWQALAALFALVHIALPLLLAHYWEPFAAWLTRNGKPLVGSEGISSWPTEAIRLVTLLLCLYLIFAGWTALSQNLDTIIKRLRLGATRMKLVADQREAERRLPRWLRVINMFSLRLILPSDVPLVSPNEAFWRRYIVQNRISARAVRTTACVLLAAGVSWFLWLAMRSPQFVPQRGELSLTVHQWLHSLMFIAIYFLVFFVVDATAFCVSFVRGLQTGLQTHRANWPLATLVKFEHELQIPRAYLKDWIDLEFIALRTKCVTRLIYYPFVVLSLFLVSRSPVFDHWYMPTAGFVLAVLGASVALACAVALRYAAEAARRSAIEKLHNEIIRVSGEAPAGRRPHMSSGELPASFVRPAKPPKPAQLALLLERMEHLHEGAFAPFWQQPLLKAILLPFAAFGGTSMLDYLALANI